MQQNKQTKKKEKKGLFERFSAKVTAATGSTAAFIAACSIVVIWAVTGPVFDYSETWQLIINTGTTIITFLMVFLIQKSQNKDSMAIQIKLDELIASNDLSSNRMVSVENMSEEELKVIRKYYERLSQLTVKNKDMKGSHSIDETADKIEQKKEGSQKGRKNEK